MCACACAVAFPLCVRVRVRSFVCVCVCVCVWYVFVHADVRLFVFVRARASMGYMWGEVMLVWIMYGVAPSQTSPSWCQCCYQAHKVRIFFAFLTHFYHIRAGARVSGG